MDHDQPKYDTDSEEDEYALPPRSTLFPSQKNKLTLYFYRSLFILFMILIAVLVGWGLLVFDPFG